MCARQKIFIAFAALCVRMRHMAQMNIRVGKVTAIKIVRRRRQDDPDQFLSLSQFVTKLLEEAITARDKNSQPSAKPK